MERRVWNLCGGIILALFVITGATSGSEPTTTERFAAANDWLYLLQPGGNYTPAAIAETEFDVVVLDYSRDGSESGEFTPQEIATIRESGKVVLAYMSIGEAETYRFYWDSAWNETPPSWLGPENPDWAGNFKVHYWDAGWQRVIYGEASGPSKSYLDRIIDQGFDGVYLDIVDAYYYWGEEEEAISHDEARQSMVGFIRGLAAYARITRGHSDFLVIPQNASEIIYGNNYELDQLGRDYLSTVNGIGVEDLFFDELTPQPPDGRDYRLNLINLFKANSAAPAKILVVDYVWDEPNASSPSNAERYNQFHTFCTQAGFTAYAAASDRELDNTIIVHTSESFQFAQPKP